MGGAALTKRRLLHPMKGKRVMDPDICTWVDSVVLLEVMRHSEVGGERSYEVAPWEKVICLRKCRISWRPFEICRL